MAAAFVLAAAAVWWATGRSRPVVPLPDGRAVTILAVTYGTNHTLIEGPLWAKAIRRFVSRPKARQLGLRIYEHTSKEPTLLVWTHWRLPSTNAAPRYASLLDRLGVESEPARATIDSQMVLPGTAIMAWQYANFPRRQSDFPIRFYDHEPGRLEFLGMALVRMRSAVLAGASAAGAPSPPVTVKQDDIEFTLALLRSGGEVATNLIRPLIQVAPWTEARFEVREGGRLATNWMVRNIRATGETGNRFQLWYTAKLSSGGDYRVAFPDVLWPDEPGWRIRAEFVREADFPETNRWMLPGIPAIRILPAFTKSIDQELTGVRIDTVELRPTTQLSRYVRGGYRRTTDLTVSFSPATERMHVALDGATDDLGRHLRFAGGVDISRGRYVVGLEVPTNSTTVDLTFVVHEGHEVEFFVKPDWVTTNAAPH